MDTSDKNLYLSVWFLNSESCESQITSVYFQDKDSVYLSDVHSSSFRNN